MSELIKFKKKNKDLQKLYDLPVGGQMEFKGQNTAQNDGIYRLLRSHLTSDDMPYKFIARTMEDVLIIKKTEDYRHLLPRKTDKEKVWELTQRLQDIENTLYGKNMGIDGWHQNGELMPFDELADHNGWFEDL